MCALHDLAAGPRAVPRRDHAERQLRLATPRPRRNSGLAFARQLGCPDAATPRPPACAARRSRLCLNASARGYRRSSPPADRSCRCRLRRRWRRSLQPGAAADRHQPQRGPDVQPGAGRADRAAGRPAHRLRVRRHAAPAILAAVPVERLPSPVHGGLHDRGHLDRQRLHHRHRRLPRPRTWPPSSPATTRTYFYQFDDLHAPGCNPTCPATSGAPGTRWNWPTCGRASTTASRCTTCSRPAQLRAVPADGQVVGRVRALGAPEASGQPFWPGYATAG